MRKNFLGVYSAPQVRFCNVHIESGFAASQPSDFFDPEFENRNEE